MTDSEAQSADSGSPDPGQPDPGPSDPGSSSGAAAHLDEALARMRWALEPGRFALLGFEEPPGPADLRLVAVGPAQLIREGGETTLLLASDRVEEARRLHPSAQIEESLAWIRFEAPMGWELVGFLALVTGRLAAAGVPLGAICGYSRDHLFIAEPHLARAASVLDELFPRAT